MKVLIVDDHALFRVGLEMLLSQLISPLQVSQAANAQQALVMMGTGNHFDLVILDWNMPKMAGMDALLAVRHALPLGRVVVVSGEQSPALIRTCIDNGAAGFIPKDSSTAQLTMALNVIASGGVFLPTLAQFSMSSDTTSKAAVHPPALNAIAESFPVLTARQCDVLQLTARGLPNKVIARELSLSEDTVKQHLSAIYQILGVRNRTEAVYIISQRSLRIG